MQIITNQFQKELKKHGSDHFPFLVMIGEAVAPAKLNPPQRFVVKRVYFAQTGDGNFVAVP